MLVSSRSGIRVVDTRTGTVVRTIRPGGSGIGADALVKRVYVLGQGKLRLLDLSTGKYARTWRSSGCAGAIALDGSLRRIFTASTGTLGDPRNLSNGRANRPGQFCVIDMDTGALVRKQAEGNGVSAELLAVDHKRQVVIVGRVGAFVNDGTQVIDERTGRFAQVLHCSVRLIA